MFGCRYHMSKGMFVRKYRLYLPQQTMLLHNSSYFVPIVM